MFPSVLNTFNRPSPTDRLNSPSHSALHNSVSSALGQVQAVIGLSTSSLLGTLFYDIRSSESDGGGHVQTTVKGGTGQTTFIKGDQLVATSPSVLSKVAVGLDGQTWVADSSVAAGIKWGSPPGTKIATSASIIQISGALFAGEGSILSVTIPGSTLGVSNAVRATVFVDSIRVNTASGSVLLRAKYGVNTTASVLFYPGTANAIKGTIVYTLTSNNTLSAQRANLAVDLPLEKTDAGAAITGSVIGIVSNTTGTSSTDAGANNVLGLTAKFSDTQNDDNIRINGYIVEKIT